MTLSVLMYALMSCTAIAFAGILMADGVRALAKQRTRVRVAAPSSPRAVGHAHRPQPR